MPKVHRFIHGSRVSLRVRFVFKTTVGSPLSSHIKKIKWRIFFDTPCKDLLTGTVPVNKDSLARTVPVNKESLTRRVPVNKESLTGRVLVNNLFQ